MTIQLSVLSEEERETLVALIEWSQQWGEPPTAGELAAGDLVLAEHYETWLATMAERGLVVRCGPRPCGRNLVISETWMPHD